MELVRSVCLSVRGCNAVLNLLSIPSCLVDSFHKSNVNMDPVSVMMSLEVPIGERFPSQIVPKIAVSSFLWYMAENEPFL